MVILSNHEERAKDYLEILSPLTKQKWCGEWHRCGYVKNDGVSLILMMSHTKR